MLYFLPFHYNSGYANVPECYVTRMNTLPVLLWIKNVGVGREAASWEVEKHLRIVMKAEESKQDVSRWPFVLKGNDLFFPLIPEFWNTIAWGFPSFTRFSCSKVKMSVRHWRSDTGWWKLIYNTEIIITQYVSDCSSCLVHKPRYNYANRLVASAQRHTKHVHIGSGTYG
jgi:hypothetical protein